MNQLQKKGRLNAFKASPVAMKISPFLGWQKVRKRPNEEWVASFFRLSGAYRFRCDYSELWEGRLPMSRCTFRPMNSANYSVFFIANVLDVIIINRFALYTLVNLLFMLFTWNMVRSLNPFQMANRRINSSMRIDLNIIIIMNWNRNRFKRIRMCRKIKRVSGRMMTHNCIDDVNVIVMNHT